MYHILERVLCSCLNVTVSRKSEPKKRRGGVEGVLMYRLSRPSCSFIFFFFTIKKMTESDDNTFFSDEDTRPDRNSQFASIPHI